MTNKLTLALAVLVLAVSMSLSAVAGTAMTRAAESEATAEQAETAGTGEDGSAQGAGDEAGDEGSEGGSESDQPGESGGDGAGEHDFPVEAVTERPGAGDHGTGARQDPAGSGRPDGRDRGDGRNGRGAQGSGRGRESREGRERESSGGHDADENETGETEAEVEPTDPLGIFGRPPSAVPNVVIDSFEIPPFLLPIYQACGTQYAIPWQLLAAINKIETAFGTNLSVSTAGATGWMQFMPGTWAMYGVDANGDGRKDPYNPVDAICAAARYLRAAGGTEQLRAAIFAYNHANWYVEDVLDLTEAYSRLPADLVSSLTGLTEGAHFPVAANSRYADQVTVREAARRAAGGGSPGAGSVSQVLSSAPGRRSVTIYSRPHAPVVAVNDGVVTAIGHSERLGHFVVLRDPYGNRYTYTGLGELMNVHPVPRRPQLSAEDFEMVTPDGERMPARPASRTDRPAPDPESIDADSGRSGDGAAAGSRESRRTTKLAERMAWRAALEAEREASEDGNGEGDAGSRRAEPVNTENSRVRLYARPDRPNNVERTILTDQLDHPVAGSDEFETFEGSPESIVRPGGGETRLEPLRRGSRVVAGTVLGRSSGADAGGSGSISFGIRPAGEDAPEIDPKPILDGWRLLEATAIYRARHENPFFTGAGVGQVLMLPKTALIRRVLSDPRLEIYSCGREDIAGGQIDRRVLALLSYLAERGYRLTVTSLYCGRSGIYTTSGNVSNHVGGRAVDIAAVNGKPILGNQGPGSITEAVLMDILRLQGTMTPSELISLHEMGGPSFAMGDHADHIHVGYSAGHGAGASAAPGADQILKPAQWTRLVTQLGRIENPTVPTRPSRASTPATAEGPAGSGPGE